LWTKSVKIDQVHEGTYLSIALEGVHGKEGAYVAAMVEGELLGAPDRAPSYPSNTWEYVNHTTGQNNTYYIPLGEEHAGKEIQLYVIGFDAENMDFQPRVYLTNYPLPYQKIRLQLEK